MSPRVPEPHLSAWRSVLNAHASVVARAEEALAQADLPPLAWYDVLWAVRRAPGRRIRMADLASGLTLSRGGLTKLADRLEAAELLRRERAEDDGRGLYAVLTAAGEQMLRRMWPVYAGVLRRTFVDAMTAAEAAAVAHALDRSNRAAARDTGLPLRIRATALPATDVTVDILEYGVPVEVEPPPAGTVIEGKDVPGFE